MYFFKVCNNGRHNHFRTTFGTDKWSALASHCFADTNASMHVGSTSYLFYQSGQVCLDFFSIKFRQSLIFLPISIDSKPFEKNLQTSSILFLRLPPDISSPFTTQKSFNFIARIYFKIIADGFL